MSATTNSPQDKITLPKLIARKTEKRKITCLTAADLDCWLWHRPELGEVSQAGDGTVLAAFEAFIAPGID